MDLQSTLQPSSACCRRRDVDCHEHQQTCKFQVQTHKQTEIICQIPRLLHLKFLHRFQRDPQTRRTRTIRTRGHSNLSGFLPHAVQKNLDRQINYLDRRIVLVLRYQRHSASLQSSRRQEHDQPVIPMIFTHIYTLDF